MVVSEVLEKPPILCPLCRRAKAGPKHRFYACQSCHEDHTLENLAKISRIPVAEVSAINYGGGGTHGPSQV